jgi:dCMP deaminase
MTRRHGQYMALASDVAQNSNCIRRAVGAIIVRDEEILAAGCNGVSETYDDCRAEGCPRCINAGIASAEHHECICRHAEQSAIADAAARGVNTRGSHIYVTRRPCFQCLAISRAAGVSGIFFAEPWTYPEELERKYMARAAEFDIFERVTGH